MGKSIFQVNQQDFFPLGFQCCNSSAYHPQEMERFWQCVAETGVNAVEIPIYWEEFEKQEGQYDYRMLDYCMEQAEKYDVKIIFLWFGTWKNGTSKFIPSWVAGNLKRYHRVSTYEGIRTNILSPYCQENREADKRAFLKFVEYIESQSTKKRTVIGIQIENEPGMMMRGYRDYSQDAQNKFQEEIPDPVKDCLQKLDMGEVSRNWKKAGGKTEGNWTEVFGEYAEEYFSVYGIAGYIEEIAKAGKALTKLPFIVNVWVDGVGWDEAGIDYPSGGPVSKVLGFWKALTPHIDVIGLDNYKLRVSEYCADCEKYMQYGNALFIPESHAWDNANSYTMFLAVGQYKTQGLFFFGPEAMKDSEGKIKDISKEIWKSIKSLISVQSVLGQFLKKEVFPVFQEERALEQRIALEDGYIRIFFDGFERADYHHGYLETPCTRGRGLLVRTDKKTFYALGDSFCLSIRMDDGKRYSRQKMDKYIDYECVEEGFFDKKGEWNKTRIRNGDESDYGIWVMYDIGAVKIVLGDGEYERI